MSILWLSHPVLHTIFILWILKASAVWTKCIALFGKMRIHMLCFFVAASRANVELWPLHLSMRRTLFRQCGRDNMEFYFESHSGMTSVSIHPCRTLQYYTQSTSSGNPRMDYVRVAFWNTMKAGSNLASLPLQIRTNIFIPSPPETTSPHLITTSAANPMSSCCQELP